MKLVPQQKLESRESRLESELRSIPQQGKLCFEGRAEIFVRQGGNGLSVLHTYSGLIIVKRIGEIRYAVYSSPNIPEGVPPHFSIKRRKWAVDTNGSSCVYTNVSELGGHNNGVVRLYPTKFK